MSLASLIDESGAGPITKPAATAVMDGSSTVANGAMPAGVYRTVRHSTEALCEPLASDDYVVQSMPDASPVKWHLAHTTWFFETFVLEPYLPDYRPFHPVFRSLFNSYYESVGSRWPRSQRGLLSRPTTVGEYNGKFMCNQFVLRGASCATPRSHARRTYRNFFPPDARWQFSGIRLAKELA